ncbi:MAG: recombinase family protein, partial [Clostridia bacterium]|nr:recombinase family protein [Clostridia bacterium]
MRESRIKEQFIGGHILYGYKVVNKKVEIDEDKAEVVRFIYEQYANDVIVKDIIQKLTDRGILNNGKPFARNTVYQILKNEKYSGVYRYGDEVFLNTYPRIVPKEIYDKVALKIADNKYGKKSNGAVFLLRQKMKCGYCGKTLAGESGTSSTGKVKYYYKCLGRKRGTKCELDVFRKEVIEEAIIEAICKTIDSPEIMSSLADDVLELQDLKEKDMSVINILREEKEKLQKNIDNIMSAIEQGLFSATAQKRLADLEARMEEINASIILEQSKNKVNITKDEIIKYFKTVLKKEPQQMIFLFVKEIIVYNDKIEVYCNYTNRKNPDGSNHQDFCFYTDNVI